MSFSQLFNSLFTDCICIVYMATQIIVNTKTQMGRKGQNMLCWCTKVKLQTCQSVDNSPACRLISKNVTNNVITSNYEISGVQYQIAQHYP